MKGLILFWALASAWAGKAAVPPVGDGHAVYEDPYVKEYRETMASVKSEMAGIKASIAAIPQPTSLAGAIASQAQLASMYAPMADLMGKAEAAHIKMLKHLMGADASTDSEFHVRIGLPRFDASSGEKPQAEQPRAQQTEAKQKPALIAARPEFLGPGAGVALVPEEPLRDAVQSKPERGQARLPADDVMDGIRERMKERQRAVERLLANRQ
ncbi:MAG: hypothetical protein WC728_07225 [Elusimicrobiota bacterium]